MFSEVCSLISETYITDSAGDSRPVKTSREVFADELSIGQSEFYQAHSEGFKPTIKLKINKIEYENESKVEYRSKIYKVMRTYSKSETIELTLEGDVHGTS